MKLETPDSDRPRCIVIAGPNGAGKTTFAREFLPKDAGVMHFVNADLIASGLSPLRPESAAIAASKLFLVELDRLARSRSSFAFESTLSGLAYASRLRKWKAGGYRLEIVYLKIDSPQLALRRIAERDDRVPRVIYNASVDPPKIVTAYFDRRQRAKP